MPRAALVAIVAALVVVQPAAARRVYVWQRSGDVHASLSYDVRNDVYRNVRLEIERAGAKRLSATIPTGCRGCPLAGPAGSDPLAARDLDADGEPEVLLDMYTGGAHCCTYTLIYRWRPDAGTYARTRAWWGNAAYRLVDLDRDGQPEFSTFDDRFAYAFTSFAASVDPIRIRRYRHGRLLDVTREFPDRVAADARRVLAAYRQLRRPPYHEVRGALAAYVGDQYLLGQPTVGWRLVRAALRRGELARRYAELNGGGASGRRYLTALRRFLRRTGYIR